MNLLQETIDVFQAVRSSIFTAMQKLHAVKESNAWEGQYSSFGEFVEDGLGISQGFASKLLSVHTHYVLEGGFAPEKLIGIDYEKLYIASKLEGTPEEQVAKAKTLTRRELREEKNDEVAHEHEPINICKTCGIRL